MGVGDEVDLLWLFSGQMTLAILIMFYIHNIYIYIHRSLLLRSLCTPNNRYMVSLDYIKHSFHNFSNVNWIEQGEVERSVEILNDL